MRALTTPEKTAAALEVTHRGWLLSVDPVGLAPVYLTTIGANYTYAANVYLGDPGFVMGRARFTDGSDPAALDIEVPVSDDGPVTPDDVTRGLYVGATVVLRIVDYQNALVSPPIGFKWAVGETRITDDGKATFEIRAESRINRELVLKTVGVPCTANWADARCGVTAATFTDTVEVDSITSLYEFTVTGSSRADGFFDNGAIKFTSGDNIDRSYTVRKWTLATRKILLWEPLRTPLVIGNDATIHAGCDKTIGAAGCAKFSNIARYQGFANLPGDDAKFSYEGDPQPPVVVTDGGGGSDPDSGIWYRYGGTPSGGFGGFG